MLHGLADEDWCGTLPSTFSIMAAWSRDDGGTPLCHTVRSLLRASRLTRWARLLGIAVTLGGDSAVEDGTESVTHKEKAQNSQSGYGKQPA